MGYVDYIFLLIVSRKTLQNFIILTKTYCPKLMEPRELFYEENWKPFNN
jgi:hypothetical protein